jgi:hypothetical protein
VPKNLRLSLLLLATFVALSSTAHATSYSASGSGGGYTGSGTFTATSQGGNEYLITGISGTGFDSLFAPGGFDGNDNLLFPTAGQYVDASGFSFTITEGSETENVDIFSTGTVYNAYMVDQDGFSETIPVTFDLTPIATSSLTTMSRMAVRSMATAPATTQFGFSFESAAPGPVTPEPSSLVLLGTGAVIAGGVVRRRR